MTSNDSTIACIPKRCDLCKDLIFPELSEPKIPIRSNLTLKRFRHILVQHLLGRARVQTWWCCLCDCGRAAVIPTGYLVSGKTQSCGCQRWPKGKDSPQWKGGRTLGTNGYMLVKQPDHPNAMRSGYIYEHRLIASKTLSRPLLPGEAVHHDDEEKLNNAEDNLEVYPTHAHHMAKHRKICIDRRHPGEENPLILCGCNCGESFLKYDGSGRPRKFIYGHQSKGSHTRKKNIP